LKHLLPLKFAYETSSPEEIDVFSTLSKNLKCRDDGWSVTLSAAETAAAVTTVSFEISPHAIADISFPGIKQSIKDALSDDEYAKIPEKTRFHIKGKYDRAREKAEDFAKLLLAFERSEYGNTCELPWLNQTRAWYLILIASLQPRYSIVTAIFEDRSTDKGPCVGSKSRRTYLQLFLFPQT
jgi:hypothetical protein